jgi:alkylhydroperoxidase family enzyme
MIATLSRERAALRWAEAVTLITNGHVADEVYEDARAHFSDKELSDLFARCGRD